MKKQNFKFLNKNVVIPSNKIKIDQIYQYITPNIPKIQLLRGMQDHFDNDARILNWIIQTAKQTSEIYGYSQIFTPILETKALFQKSLGLGSDIVTHEMFHFEDAGSHAIALRPEGTASVARCFINNSFPLPKKFFYAGPMFRHEKPQKGRSREFYQFGIELFGSSQARSDAEVLDLAWNLLKNFQVTDQVQLYINTLGDEESRENYKTSLHNYFEKHFESLSKLSKERFKRGTILRILDSKEPEDKSIIASAPSILDFLTTQSAQRFTTVLKYLDLIKIPYLVQPKLVRGLDYYCHTIFEFVSTSEKLGAQQNTLIGGGRYDGLVKHLGGEDVSTIGFAGGIERIQAILPDNIVPPLNRPIYVISLSSKEEELSEENKLAFEISTFLKKLGIHSSILFSGSIKKQISNANKQNSCGIIILGEDELQKKEITLKNLDTSEQTSISFQNFFQMNKEEVLNLFKTK